MKKESATEASNKTFNVKGVEFEMIYIEGGTFTMGATAEQGASAAPNEKPTHEVTVSDFYLGKYQVTQALWQAVMGANPSKQQGNDQLPVEWISWNNVQTFIAKLNELTGEEFCMPTEAEWEYAARGGNKSQGFKFSGSNNAAEVAWHEGNSEGKTHPVGEKLPNELGLYDMSGNVGEWCNDWYGGKYYDVSPAENPQGPEEGKLRVVRGGSHFDRTWLSRVAARRFSLEPQKLSNAVGFRLAMKM